MKEKKRQLIKFVSDNKIIFIIMIGFLILNLYNLRNWYFSAIGDEYAHFNYAKSIAIGAYSPNIFSQRGVYGAIPTLSSYYQAIIMKILGINVFGWKASHVLLVSITIPSLYFLCKKILSKQVAILTAFFYASNHFLWAYVHTGYSQVEALFPFAISLLAFAYRRFFLCGVLAGLGFYTFYTSRITILIVLVWLFITYRKIDLKGPLLSLLSGFGILLLPFLFVNRDFIVQDMLKHTLIAQNDPSTYGPWYKFIFDNLIRNGLAPWSNTNTGHYVFGSIVDYLTGFFLIIGTVIILKNIHCSSKTSIKLLIIYIVPFLIIAVFSPYATVAISRLHILMPAYSIFAGIGAFEFFKLIKHGYLRNIILFSIVIITLWLNIDRFFIQGPKARESTIDAITIKALTTSCRKFSSSVVVGNTRPLLTPALEAYEIDVKVINYFEAEKKFNLNDVDCIVFMQPENQRSANYLKIVRELKYLPKEVADFSGHKKVLVFTKNNYQ